MKLGLSSQDTYKSITISWNDSTGHKDLLLERFYTPVFIEP